jgi:hypothetical protein
MRAASSVASSKGNRLSCLFDRSDRDTAGSSSDSRGTLNEASRFEVWHEGCSRTHLFDTAAEGTASLDEGCQIFTPLLQDVVLMLCIMGLDCNRKPKVG